MNKIRLIYAMIKEIVTKDVSYNDVQDIKFLLNDFFRNKNKFIH